MTARRRTDRFNPVFLKELRQALRGRMFAILFPIVVALGVGLAIAVLIDAGNSPNLGPTVFMPVITVLGVAVLGLVPFSAFQSMASEWDEGTHDLLVLSHLSPLRIVLGKLLTAAIEAVLYVSAFLPLLLFTFLLSGVDVRDVLVLVGMLYAASLAMSCAAMALAGLSRLKLWRVILMVVLAGLGLLALIGGYDVAESMVLRGRGIGSASLRGDVAVSALLIVCGGATGFAFAATRIAHPEDDRSGPVRIVLTALLVLGLAWTSASVPFAVLARQRMEIAMVFGVLSACLAVFFVTEPERLPRRAASRVPANGLLALAATPFLPGGGRGVMWWFLQLAILGAWAQFIPSRGTPSVQWQAWDAEGAWRWATMMAYFCVYLAGFSLLMGPLRRRAWGPLAARLILPSAAVLSMVVPILMDFLVGGQASHANRHVLNPFWVATTSSGTDAARAGVVLVAVLVIAANGPRLVRSVQEILDASRARRRVRAEREGVAAHVA